MDGLEDAIRIIKGVWTQPSFTYRGRLYHTDGAELTPKPDRRIPIWLGTFGNRALDVTGRLADGWIPSLGHASPEQVYVMRGRMLATAHAAGRDPLRSHAGTTCRSAWRIDLSPTRERSPVRPTQWLSGSSSSPEWASAR